MKLRARLMRWLRGESTDTPVHLHVSAPTVSRRKTGDEFFLFGSPQRVDTPPARSYAPPASLSVVRRRIDGVPLDYSEGSDLPEYDLDAPL